MSDILDRTEQHRPTIVRPALVAGNRPQAIVPTDIDGVWRVADIVIKSKLNPHDLDTKEKVTVALMHGLEIGLPPMMALQRIAVINGRPSVWGDAVPGIALATGELEDWQEYIEGDGDYMVATCIVKRKGIKTPKKATFSVADAKRADLWDTREKVKRKNYKTGQFYEADNDSPWFRYPKRMLTMRARVVFRDLFADAFGGLYIAEELLTKEVTLAPSEYADVSAQQTLAPPTQPLQTGEHAQEQKQPQGMVIEGAGTETTEREVSSSGKPLPPRARTRSPEPKSAAAPITTPEEAADAASATGSSAPDPQAEADLLDKDELLAGLAKAESKLGALQFVQSHQPSIEALSDADRRAWEKEFEKIEARLPK